MSESSEASVHAVVMRKPSEVVAIERLRMSPFCKMFGCAENEETAEAVIKWLAKNGDSWSQQVPASLFDNDHGHGFTGSPAGGRGACSLREYFNDGVPSVRFISMATRSWDWSQFRSELIDRLISGTHA